MKQKIIYVLAVLIIIIGSLGLFYSNGGNRTQVTSKYGEEIELYGDGIYAYDSVFQATTYKGTDIAAIIFGFALIIMNIKATKSNKFKLMRAGVLLILLYLSTCYTMEVSFNRIYLLYLVTFIWLYSSLSLSYQKSYGGIITGQKFTKKN